MKTLNAFFAVFALLASVRFCLAADVDVAEHAIKPFLSPGLSLGDVQAAPLCGGVAAKTDSGAVFWIAVGKKNLPFAVNGVAKNMVPTAYLSPPSISVSTVDNALAGKALPKPEASLHQLWLTFPKKIEDAAKALGLPKLQKDGYYNRKLVCKSGQKAVVEMREQCGAVVEVQAVADGVVRSKDTELTAAVVLRVVPGVLSPDVPSDERDKVVMQATEKSAKNSGEYVDFTLGKVAYRVIALKGDKKGTYTIGLEATPAQ